MKKLLILPLLFIACMSYAQDISPAMQNLYHDFKTLQLRDWETYKKQVEGSPYYFDDFRETVLYLKNEKDTVVQKVRFNIIDDRMELIQDDVYYVFSKDTSLFYRFKIDSVLFEIVPIEYARKPLTYAEVIADGKYSLLARHKVVFREGEDPKGYADAVPPQYIRQVSDYYIRNTKGEYISVKNFKDIIKMFPKKGSELTKFVKNKKLKFKNKEDIQVFFEYLNGVI